MTTANALLLTGACVLATSVVWIIVVRHQLGRARFWRNQASTLHAEKWVLSRALERAIDGGEHNPYQASNLHAEKWVLSRALERAIDAGEHTP